MDINITNKAKELLELLANSILDNETSRKDPICFTIKQINLIEHFLIDFINEQKMAS